MRRYVKPLLIATTAMGLLGTTAAVWSQPSDSHMGIKSGHHRSADHATAHTQRHTELKAALKLTPAQETAWTAFMSSMQRPSHASDRLDRDEWARLTTPQRIEKMEALHNERQAASAKRLEGIKQFYALLTPEQQAIFDREFQTMGGMGHRGHRGEHGRHG